jgi:hypothetical protein
MSRILFDGFDPPVVAPVLPAPSFSFSPPGGIGLPAQDAIVLLRFDETAANLAPKDAAGGLADLGIVTGLAQPDMVDAALGRGRQFNAGTTSGFVAQDLVPGSTLLTRDMSVQFVASFDMAHQISYGTPAQIAKRGKGNAWGASERCSWAINSSHVGVAAGDCALSWEWETVAGVLKVQAGVVFTPPPPGQFTMITMTRRWLSPTSVVLRYYAGDVLLGEVASVDGDIGGATTGTTGIGSVGQGGGSGYGRTFALGIIDELLVIDRELTREEIEATWLRITRYQPLGYQLIREMHDPGFPLPTDPGSDVQMDLRMVGNGLGYAAAQAESVRVNILPQRAFGSVLEDWEEATRVTPQPSDGIDERRARVVAKIRQRRGCTIPGLQDSLVGLLGGADVSQLQFLAFSDTFTDAFTTLDPLRWDGNTVGGWAAVSGAARSSPAAGTYTFNGTTQSWIYARTSVAGEGREAHILAKVAMTTPQANLETGLFFGQVGLGNYLLFGMRDVAGVFTLIVERFRANVSLGGASALLGANPANLWLHIFDLPGSTAWQCEYSITSATTGFIVVDSTAFADLDPQWAGMYVRSIGATAGAAQVNVDDFTLRATFGTSPLNAYVLLDQALGFSPDSSGAQSVISAIRHAFTQAAFITRRSFLCDDLQSGCDLGPLGGY